ncbi:TRAP transporter small permease [Rhodoligotrophos defluvii]|uniref:TRAP transporter small permease n=1 Tax=Rhodoligotrophos defluvii TaxID=2561934 RepID=UPI0014857C28|nr:TRAP transporter small permease [Rhodoligotrophos defluvii]
MNAVQENGTTGPFRWYIRLVRLVAGTTMLAIVLIVLAQVAARYLFNSSLIWAEELCRYLLLWQTFFVVGYAYQRGEMVSVDFLPNLLSPRGRFLLRLVLAIPILIFLWLLASSGYAYSQRFTHQIIPALDFIWNSLTGERAAIPISTVYISVAVGCVLLGLHIIASLVMEYRALGQPSPQPQQQQHLPRV